MFAPYAYRSSRIFSSKELIVEDEKVNKYLPSFIFECKQLLASMTVTLEKISSGDTSNETLFELYRLAHSIGSSALTVNLVSVSNIARLMEAALEQYGEEFPPAWDTNLETLLSFTIDRLVEVIAEIEATEKKDFEADFEEMKALWEEVKNIFEFEQDDAIDEVEEEPVEPTTKEEKSRELDSVVADFFKIEAEEHLKNLQDGFLGLEKDPKNEQLIEEVFRAAHTLKGAASTVGFRSTEVASHAIEDVLEPIRDGQIGLTPNTVDVLLGSLDALVEVFRLECDDDPKSAQAAGEVVKILGKLSGKEVDKIPAETQVFFAEKRESGQKDESVTVRLSKLDSLMNLSGELLVQQSKLVETREKFSTIAESVRLSLRRLASLNTDLSQQQLMTRATQAMKVRIAPSADEDSKFADEFDELELDRYNELDRIVKNETEVHADLTEALFDLENEISELIVNSDSLMQSVSTIQGSVISTRLIPINHILNRFPRMVRDLAKSEKKLIDLRMYGEDVEVDITVLRNIFDPLLHLVRNAVHHGIETPEVRDSLGKSKQGAITIDARYVGNQVLVNVSNDGTPLDTSKISDEAERIGLATREELEKMSDEEINNFIFLSGFSTSEETGLVAGRGVGLDVVKNTVEAIGGSISVETSDASTSFLMTLPISLVISQGIVVNASDQKFIFPLGSIQEVAKINKSDIEMIGSGPVVKYRDELLPIRYLDEILLMDPKISKMSEFPVLIVSKGASLSMIAVSSIEGRQDIMIKKLPTCLEHINIFSGVSIFGSGYAYPVLNTSAILTKEYTLKKQEPLDVLKETQVLNILVVEDSLSMRKILKMDLESAGFNIYTASSGLEALDIIESKPIDGIILDIEMPEMDGFEFMSILRDEKTLSTIPKMIITSRAGQKHRDKAFGLGADAYLIKPYDKQIVLSTLTNLVSG